MHANVDNYTTSFVVDKTPMEVYQAVTHPRLWWSKDIEGNTDLLGSIFYYQFKDVHRGTFRVTELEPGKKVVWHVLQNFFNFVKDSVEWTDTDIIFEIAEQGDKTELAFTHVGLKPSEECYQVCHDAWGFYIRKSLYDLIVNDIGEPNRSNVLSKNNPVQK